MSAGIPKFEGFSQDKILALSRARSFEQFKEMVAAYRAGKCPFCDPLGARNVVIREANGWRMWANPYPARHTKFHFVMAPRKHTEVKSFISDTDFQSIGSLFNWARQRFKIKGGGLVMRFGLPELNSGTIAHLHANIIVPDGCGEVRVALAKTPEDVQRGITRLTAFKKLLDGASPEDLTPDERTLARVR